MDGGSVSEHCFNFQDAKHEEGTNKYTFKYPSSWHLMDEACDLSVGIRSILLKPGSFDTTLNNLWLIGYGNVEYSKGVTTLTRMEQPTKIMTPGGSRLLPERLSIPSSIIVDETVDMYSYCKQMNEQYRNDFKDLEQFTYGFYNTNKYLGMYGNSFRSLFTRDGSFYMGVGGQYQYLVYVNPAKIKDKKIDIQSTPIDCFDEGFHELLGLDYTNENTNLNACFKRLLVLDAANDEAGYTEESFRQNRNGIFFGNRALNPAYKEWYPVLNETKTKTFVASDEYVKSNFGEPGSTKSNYIDEYTIGTEQTSFDGLTFTYTEVSETDGYRITYQKRQVYDPDLKIINETETTEEEECTNRDTGILKKDEDGHYNYIYEHVHSALDLDNGSNVNFMFKRLQVCDVWSRKGLLVTSSIAEFDNRNYLGYTSFNANNTNAVYPNPKMYELTSRSDEFWIEIYDSLTNKKIELPENSNVLIEACLYQRDKRTFNRQ